MVTVIIPGFSAKNKEWADEAAKSLNTGGTIRPLYWDHWTDPNAKFSAAEKARLVTDLAENEQINIVAKSIGTLVASYAILKNPVKIRKVIFCGIPFNDISEEDKEVIKEAMKMIPSVSIICFQNEEDPHGGFDQLKMLLSGFGSSIEAISEPAENHEYPYYQEFRSFLLG